MLYITNKCISTKLLKCVLVTRSIYQVWILQNRDEIWSIMSEWEMKKIESDYPCGLTQIHIKRKIIYYYLYIYIINKREETTNWIDVSFRIISSFLNRNKRNFSQKKIWLIDWGHFGVVRIYICVIVLLD